MVLHVQGSECSYGFAPPRFFGGAPDQGGQPGWVPVQHFIYTHTHILKGGAGGGSHKEFFIVRSILTVRYLKTLPVSAHYFFLRLLISEPLKIGFSMFTTAKSLFFLNC